MTCYWTEPTDCIFVKEYEFLSFTRDRVKNIKNIGKSVSKNWSNKYIQKRFDHAKESAIDALETTSKVVIQKTAEPAVDSIGNEIIDTASKSYNDNFTRTSAQETDLKEETDDVKFDAKISKEGYISPKEKDSKLLMS